MPIGAILLAVVAVLVYFGVLHRVLDRMRLSDTTAFVILLLMAIGAFVDIPIVSGDVPVRVNLGGALIPLAVVIWLVATADEAHERLRSVFAVIATAAVVWGLTKVLNPEEQFMRFSPVLVFGIAAGVIAALAGRSRRAAFVGGVGGMVVADLIHYVELMSKNLPGAVSFGGAGALDSTVIAGILAVGLMEVFGEARERVVKTQAAEGDEMGQEGGDQREPRI